MILHCDNCGCGLSEWEEFHGHRMCETCAEEFAEEVFTQWETDD